MRKLKFGYGARLTWVKVKSEVTKSCPTLCDPMDCSLPGSSVRGIFQARVLEWVAISFSRGSSWPGDQTQVSGIERRFSTLQADTLPEWTAKLGCKLKPPTRGEQVGNWIKEPLHLMLAALCQNPGLLSKVLTKKSRKTLSSPRGVWEGNSSSEILLLQGRS